MLLFDMYMYTDHHDAFVRSANDRIAYVGFTNRNVFCSIHGSPGVGVQQEEAYNARVRGGRGEGLFFVATNPCPVRFVGCGRFFPAFCACVLHIFLDASRRSSKQIKRGMQTVLPAIKVGR